MADLFHRNMPVPFCCAQPDGGSPYLALPRPLPLPLRPPLVRGRVYCGADFVERASDWFMAEQRQAKEAERAATGKTTTTTTTTTSRPTRVQPARAAKRKAEEAMSRTGGPKKRARRALSTKTNGGYALERSQKALPRDDDSGSDEVDVFRETLADLLAGQARLLSQTCAWARRPSLSSSRSPSSAWCPIAAQPLACAERVQHGEHGSGRATTDPPLLAAPEPPMTASVFAETAQHDCLFNNDDDDDAHVAERTVALRGLRFAVDVCRGTLRVMMA